jgi:FkbM family methyltransferase
VLARDTSGLSDDDRRWTRTRAEGNARRSIAAAGRAHATTTSLATGGIRSLVLKGTPLAVVTTGDPAGRWWDDIDLLVDSDRYEDAHRRLLESGWPHTAGTLAVTTSPSGLGRAVANSGTRGLERFRGHLPELLARQVHRLPGSVDTPETSPTLPGSTRAAMLAPVTDRPTLPHRLRTLVHRFGIDIRRWPPPRDPALAHVGVIVGARIDLILDVGAAGGGYALMLRDRGHRGRIVSCEPLPTSFERLRVAAADDPGWQVRQIAVGAAPGTASLQIAGNADSSSLLPMLDAHTAAAPHTATVGEVEVDVTTVDDLLDEFARPNDRVLLKLDVQGAESAVLDGTTLNRITVIHLEHSLVELYAGSATFDALHGRLRDGGFRLVDVSPGFRDPRNSQLLQFDATYLRDADD